MLIIYLSDWYTYKVMTDFSPANKTFPYLKDFAAFLLENSLQEAAEANIKIARQVELPLLNLFAHLSEQELIAFARQGLETFFNELLAQNALQHAKDSLLSWRTDTLPNIPRNGVATADLVLAYHVRKLLLLEFIAPYTTDVPKAIAIAKELDTFYAEVEQFAFNLYVELKEEEHLAYNDKLQAQQIKLEEAFEELMASREELQQTNQTLKEQAQARKEVEAVLEKERSFLQAVLEHISDGIVACDKEGVLTLFNNATRQFHGIPERILTAEHWSSYYSLYHADGVTPLAKAEIPLYRAFTGDSVDDVEIVIAPLKGKKRTLLTNGQPIVSAQGEKLGAVVVMHDITELKQSQQRQQQALMDLDEINKELAAAVEELQAAEEQLLEVNNELENRVAARTKELKSSELQMKTITDALPVLITYVDDKFRYRFVNKTYEDWFGLSPTEVIGKTLEEVFGKQLGTLMGRTTYEGMMKNLQRVFKGEHLNLETTLSKKNAGIIPISVHYIPYKVEEQVLGYFALATDISEHKKAQQQLEESRDELNFAIEATELGTWDLNPATNTFKANNRLKKWFGLQPEEEVLLLHAVAVVAQKDKARVTAAIQHSLQFSSGGQYDIEYTIVHPVTKKERIVRARGRAWFNDNKEVYRFNGTLQDITQEVMARQQLEASEKEAQALTMELQAANEEIMASNEELLLTNQQLRHINADLDNFIYTASHDLRAPISNIEGLMHAMLRNLTPEISHSPLFEKLFGLVTDSIERFKRTIDELTQISKIQREGNGADVEQVALSRIIQEVQLDLGDQIAEAVARFEVNLQHCQSVQFSTKNARSIVYNLLSNALKYRSAKRPLLIRISCQQQGDYLVLSVQDNGLGMSHADTSKIFGMFKRLHDHVEGSGIGLYIVKKIIENAGGKIEVESQPDQGSTFRLYFRQTRILASSTKNQEMNSGGQLYSVD